ncbi:Tetratricopeptide-like helical domain superfamily [Sesbania bispinosa]|nr:Tetratricopeptide-like helical domain superfamily [Sesbania bispinosa]
MVKLKNPHGENLSRAKNLSFSPSRCRLPKSQSPLVGRRHCLRLPHVVVAPARLLATHRRSSSHVFSPTPSLAVCLFIRCHPYASVHLSNPKHWLAGSQAFHFRRIPPSVTGVRRVSETRNPVLPFCAWTLFLVSESMFFPLRADRCSSIVISASSLSFHLRRIPPSVACARSQQGNQCLAPCNRYFLSPLTRPCPSFAQSLLLLPAVALMQSIYRAVVRDSSCICYQALASINLFSSIASCHPAGASDFWHKEQCQDLMRSVNILTAKVGKGSNEEEILQSLLNDQACDGIHLSQNLIDRMLYRYKDDWKSALGIFKWASSRSNFKHSPESYDMMVDILGRMKVMEKLRDLLEEMRQQSLITLNTIAKVMRRFVGAGQWADAVRIFDDLQTLGLEKNTESMNLLLDTLCKEKFVEQAREIFLELKQHIAPNAHTFNIFIHGWYKVGRVDEAYWTIQEMKGYGCRPCVISYSTIIQCYCQEHNFNRVYELLDEMQAQDCSPSVVTYTIIMSALAKAEKFDEALQLVERMRSAGCKPDTVFFNSFIYMLGRAGRIDDATYIFKEAMPMAGVAPNTSTYNSMISMFCHYAQEKMAFDILKEMEDSSLCKPDIQTYHPLIKSCFKTGKIDSLLNDILYDMVDKHHLGLDLSTYTLLIHGLCRADRCKWAFFLFEEMIDQDIVPRFRTCRLLLDEVKQKNMYGAAEKIEDLMKKL